ncbi:MotA/TolQ/ExbB proton channel family protein [Paraflavisolibacter sp. H34]|uniref:MotA/TolQ/ExbB proton channel family protein n=1 Tax=Huijunlia imazamoxiresistens TaxID=3127457 RepID=UPI0030186E83
MGSPDLHFLLLGIVILLQIIFLGRTIAMGNKIKNIFSASESPYEVTENEGRHYIHSKSKSGDLSRINDEINRYLSSHYFNNKTPDISQIFLMIKDRSRVHDSLAGFFATIPILIGLAGTVLGLFFAFFNFQSTDTAEAADFLNIISKSSSIAFIGTLSGITCTIIGNYYNNHCKMERDISMNLFLSFLNTHLSPLLPTLKDETVALVATSLHHFSQDYFHQFENYTSEFRQINQQISLLYHNGLKDIIERNSQNLEKLNLYIDKLESLNEISKGITFQPALVSEFSTAASRLVQSLDDSAAHHRENVRFLEDLLTAYRKLEERAHNNIIDLTADKQVFADYGLAIRRFIETGEQRMNAFSAISASFDEELKTMGTEYVHTVGVVKKELVEQVERTFDTEGYRDFARQIQIIQASVEKESENIRQLATAFAQLNDKVSHQLIPAFSKTSDSLNTMNVFLRNDLPRALENTIEANKRMVQETSRQLLTEPRSWGQWSFQLVQRLFKGKKKGEGR